MLARLRFRKEVLRELCKVLRPDLEPHTRLMIALSVETKVIIALNFYAIGSFQSATANISNISQFSAHRSIRQVTDALYRRRVDYISFPMMRNKQVDRQAGFSRISGFQRVQGVIDCIHIGLRAPQHHPKIFVNPQIRILFGCLEKKGYPLSTWLLTPLRNPRTAAEHAYNDAHSGTRCSIAHCIGILKQRFRCLDQSGVTLQYAPEWVSIFMVVCTMLHNLAIMRGQPLQVEPVVPPDQEEAQEEQEKVQEEEEDPHRRPARRHRRHHNPAREVQIHRIAARIT
uniref:putative nuclease HARBI1 n=1 Tax=Pristiophorus japonicus TaxID=55135 RepID=UPI00398E53C4